MLVMGVYRRSEWSLSCIYMSINKTITSWSLSPVEFPATRHYSLGIIVCPLVMMPPPLRTWISRGEMMQNARCGGETRHLLGKMAPEYEETVIINGNVHLPKVEYHLPITVNIEMIPDESMATHLFMHSNVHTFICLSRHATIQSTERQPCSFYHVFPTGTPSLCQALSLSSWHEVKIPCLGVSTAS